MATGQQWVTSLTEAADLGETRVGGKAANLSRLLRPRSVAVFGGYWAERVVAQCGKMGFAGEVWPVSPSREPASQPSSSKTLIAPDDPDR